MSRRRRPPRTMLVLRAPTLLDGIETLILWARFTGRTTR